MPDHTRHIANIGSHVLMVAALVITMWQGLLPGLLCVCLGYLATRWLSPHLSNALRIGDHRALVLASTLVILLPLLLAALAIPRTRGILLDAPNQYRDLLALMAQTIMELRDRLPAELANQFPEGVEDIQHALAVYLASKAGTLATMGRAWLGGVLLAFVGLLIGALAAVQPPTRHCRPLAAALNQRLRHFGDIFRQIMVAQFWIALLNTSLTAVFLLAILPWWGHRLPFTTALILLTFVAGLIPIVGNLICNTALTLVGLSVSPGVAAACLAFLIAIHKSEYVINAKIVGHRTHMRAWELLASMFVMEATFGPAGLVAAPLFYAYAKKELQATGWV